MNRRFFAVALLCTIGLIGCTTTGPGSMQLRVHNTSATALTITVGGTDFGSVAAGATSGYMEIDEGDLAVTVNGASAGTESFCTGCKQFEGTSSWTADFDETGITGFSID